MNSTRPECRYLMYWVVVKTNRTLLTLHSTLGWLRCGLWTLASGAGRGARSRVGCTAPYCTVLFCTVLTCNQFVSLNTTASFIWSWMGYYTYICRLQISNNFGGPQGLKKILHYLNHLPYWYLHNQQSAKCLINSGPGHLCILSRTMCHLSMIFWLRKHPHKIWLQFHL